MTGALIAQAARSRRILIRGIEDTVITFNEIASGDSCDEKEHCSNHAINHLHNKGLWPVNMLPGSTGACIKLIEANPTESATSQDLKNGKDCELNCCKRHTQALLHLTTAGNEAVEACTGLCIHCQLGFSLDLGGSCVFEQ